MSTRVKLTQPGESRTLHILSVQKATTGQYPGIEFVGVSDGREIMIEVPVSSAERQVTRLGLTYAECVGKDLTISRAANAAIPTKPFWNVEYANPAAIGAPRAIQTAPRTPEPPPPDDRDAPPEVGVPPISTGLQTATKLNGLFELHRACFEHAVGLGEWAKDRGVGIHLDSLSALTAQVFIAATNRGLGQ